jgi:DNA-binding NarL/FixJ family response regulator
MGPERRLNTDSGHFKRPEPLELCPSVKLADISMPGGGLEAVEVIIENRQKTKIVILTHLQRPGTGL